jgi:hypothetical protein
VGSVGHEGHRAFGGVAPFGGDLPFVVCLDEDRAGQAERAAGSGKTLTTSVQRLTSLLSRSSGLVGYSIDTRMKSTLAVTATEAPSPHVVQWPAAWSTPIRGRDSAAGVCSCSESSRHAQALLAIAATSFRLHGPIRQSARGTQGEYLPGRAIMSSPLGATGDLSTRAGRHRWAWLRSSTTNFSGRLRIRSTPARRRVGEPRWFLRR